MYGLWYFATKIKYYKKIIKKESQFKSNTNLTLKYKNVGLQIKFRIFNL